MRSQPMGVIGLAALLVPVIGLILVTGGLLEGRRNLRLLEHRELAGGILLNKKVACRGSG